MRVALIDPGGFTIPYDISLARALAEGGHEVCFVGCPLPRDVDWPAAVPYRTHYYRLSQRFRSPGTTPGRAVKALKGAEHLLDSLRLPGLMRELRPHVIHFQWMVLPFVDGRLVKRLRSIAPVVLTVHDTTPFHGHPTSRFQLPGFQETLSLFDALIVHTEYSKRELTRVPQVDAARVHVVDHGVLDYYTTFRPSPESPNDNKLRILCFGALKPYKGLDVAIQAVAALPPEVRVQVQLDVVGSPRMDVRPLRQLAADLGVDDQVVWDLRHVPEHEVGAIFARASVVALPYRRIDQSGVLMLAMAMGKPVVASRVGGFPEVIEDGVHGFLVEPGDVEGLAQAFLRLIGDAGMRERMSASLRHLASSRYSWDRVAAETTRIYDLVRRTSGD